MDGMEVVGGIGRFKSSNFSVSESSEELQESTDSYMPSSRMGGIRGSPPVLPLIGISFDAGTSTIAQGPPSLASNILTDKFRIALLPLIMLFCHVAAGGGVFVVFFPGGRFSNSPRNSSKGWRRRNKSENC